MKLSLISVLALVVLYISLLAQSTTDQRQCERQEGQQRSLSRLGFQQRYKRGEEEKKTNEEKEEDPYYVFGFDKFITKLEGPYGFFSFLPRFTKKSQLLRGIENYRVGILLAVSEIFLAPIHWDADAVLFVGEGRGTITMIHAEGERRSFNFEGGDVIRVRAGTPFYLINNVEKSSYQGLLIVAFIKTVNLPGEFEAFRASASHEDNSFYKAFSSEWLEAAFKTDRMRIERVLRQKRDAIVKISREQVQAMTHRDQGGGFGGELSGTRFNLLQKRPVQSNNYGQLFEAKPNDHEQLKDLDLMISLANMTEGSMSGPFKNSRATKISIVTYGWGYFEMACPQVTGGSDQKRNITYKKVSSQLRAGTMFITPAGHPVAIVASTDLKVVSFEVNAQGNIRNPLAGRNNVVKQWEREAKELAFGTEARDDVEQVFGSQDEEWFFPGPKMQTSQGNDYA